MLDLLWPGQDQSLRLDEVVATADELELQISAIASTAHCPLCQSVYNGPVNRDSKIGSVKVESGHEYETSLYG